MATIADLPNKNIEDMTTEELMEAVKAVRSRRRNPDPELKAKATKIAIQKKNKTVALQSVDSMVKGMTPAQAAELLAALSKK